MKKNREVRVRFSSDEYQKVLKKAQRVGQPVSTFLRTLGLISTLETTNSPS